MRWEAFISSGSRQHIYKIFLDIFSGPVNGRNATGSWIDMGLSLIHRVSHWGGSKFDCNIIINRMTTRYSLVGEGIKI